MAEDHAVSFFAPDETDREVRCALHFPRTEDARRFAALLLRG